jgi:hypothetical protein
MIYEFSKLGRKLSKNEQKKLAGGVVAPPPYIKGLVGWNLDANGNCWCDFLNYQTAMDALSLGAQVPPVLCGISCPVTMCTEGSMDPDPFSA